MHPVANLRGSLSSHLAGRRIVLAVCGSIAAVKTVELARELGRHGAEVHAVLSKAGAGIIGPDALEFATGNPVIMRLSGQVEHVALLGDVPHKADLLLVAPATANTVSKMALGVDDTVVTTCATVAFGTGTPVVLAPAMHEAMLTHPIVGEHAKTLVDKLGVTWVEPKFEERKAKLADVEHIVEAVIHRLATRPGPSPRGRPAYGPGPLAGKRALVITGSTAEPIDPVRVITNRSSGKSGHILALELSRLGADVTVWEGHVTDPLPSYLAEHTTRFSSHTELMTLAESVDAYDQIWMPAAINDYAPQPSAQKIASGDEVVEMSLHRLAKVAAAIRQGAPEATLVLFKAESDEARLEAQARKRMQEHGAQFVVGNTADAFGADTTKVTLFSKEGATELEGPKTSVLADVARTVAESTQASASTEPRDA